MDREQIAIQFCGFGGQGVILASVIFGTAAVTKKDYYAVQTQSFGSEARGGECQAELVLSKSAIYSPSADEADILVAMSDLAFNRYLVRLRQGGDLLIDPDMVSMPKHKDVRLFKIDANRIARDLGFSMASNMVFLGALQNLTRLITEEELFETIRQSVNAKYADANISAAKQGISLMAAQLN